MEMFSEMYHICQYWRRQDQRLKESDFHNLDDRVQSVLRILQDIVAVVISLQKACTDPIAKLVGRR